MALSILVLDFFFMFLEFIKNFRVPLQKHLGKNKFNKKIIMS